ncbi:recombinase family protein [Pseudomonas guariconensis]|uniref:recombinase family protein n=1 Tax=Pseudomonas guariconensis TaxID=1288410 RepID=UPI0039E80C03
MSRAFAYCRVSTVGQTTVNQILELKSAGFHIEDYRVVEETISGSVPANKRPGYQKLLERLECGDQLLVTKLDRLGRNAMDVRQSVENLTNMGVKVYCLALGGADLTSAAGKMTMQLLGAVAEFERDLLVERTQAGLKRAVQEGQKLGRPPARQTTADVGELKAQKFTQSQTAKKLGISIATVKRHWNK